jgi:hypothetical protein
LHADSDGNAFNIEAPEVELFTDLHQGPSATTTYRPPRLLGWETFMPKETPQVDKKLVFAS